MLSFGLAPAPAPLPLWETELNAGGVQEGTPRVDNYNRGRQVRKTTAQCNLVSLQSSIGWAGLIERTMEARLAPHGALDQRGLHCRLDQTQAPRALD
eukprot:3284905-Lingulodinium_polyedra.AAC.1